MSRTLVSGLVIIAFIVGCAAASTVVPAAVAGPGATAGQHTECVGVSLWTTRGKSLNRGDVGKTVRVPEGWEVVGGGMGLGSDGGGGAGMVICR